MKKWIWLCLMPLALLAACAKNPPPPLHTSSSDAGQTTPISSSAYELPMSESEDGPTSENIEPSEGHKKQYDLETAVSSAIINENRERYLTGECAGEGHTVLGTVENEDQVKVYLLAMFGWYQFQDGNFVKLSGSGAIPTVLTFHHNQDGAYSLNDYDTAQDGSLYTPSIKELFPEEYWEICISPSEDSIAALTEQEQGYAAAYLKEIGRNAEIGDYSDFEHTLLTDVGVSVEVSNRLAEQKDNLIARCPDWLGNVEQVENGVRYQYTRAYDREKKEIVFSKMDLTSNHIVEETVFHSESGDLIRHRNADSNIVSFERELNSLTGVSMEVVEGSLNAVSLKLLLKNETDLEIIYGDTYELQRYFDGQWRSVPYIIDNWAFHDIAYTLKKSVPQEITVDWQVFHGSLEPGKYRIIKDISDFRGTGDYTKYNLGAEFEIKSPD